MSDEGFKSGFVNIVGNPNVGKSTLMNLLVGEKLSIVTPKSQTTRHRIIGIVNTDDMQIVYCDTPGVVKPGYLLQERMRAFSESALSDADIILYVTDVVEKPEKNLDFIQHVAKAKVPVIVLVNKIDLSDNQRLGELVEQWHALLPEAEILPISATNRFNIEPLQKRICELLPVAPRYFEADQLTDRPVRFFVSEVIRGKALRYYAEEIPYAVEVEVTAFKEAVDRIDIEAVIIVERESQKGIIIGHGGKAIKKLGTASRKTLEQLFDKHIRLDLFVRVATDWRSKDSMLNDFGYLADK